MRLVAFILFAGIMGSYSAFAQKAAEALENNNSTLQERFDIMKNKSSTYEDYRVIKGYVLDGMWKLTMDSFNAQKSDIHEAKASIAKLENQMASFNSTLEEKDAAIAELEHDGTHISVLGIDMLKSALLSLVGVVILGLMVLVGVLFARMRWIQRSIKEKTDFANGLSNEFEEYKRKALDKQMKLSRELQDQRNKLQELGIS